MYKKLINNYLHVLISIVLFIVTLLCLFLRGLDLVTVGVGFIMLLSCTIAWGVELFKHYPK